MPKTGFDKVAACHDDTYVPKPGDRPSKALTKAGIFSGKEWPTWANSMDICSWFRKACSDEGFRTLDATRIAEVRSDEYRGETAAGNRAIRRVEDLWGTILHEVSLHDAPPGHRRQARSTRG